MRKRGLTAHRVRAARKARLIGRRARADSSRSRRPRTHLRRARRDDGGM